jgi:hypothetical protein
LPFPLAILLFLPALAGWGVYHSYHDTAALGAVAASDQYAAKLVNLVRDGQTSPFAGMPFAEVDRLPQPDYRGFVFLTDGQIVDLRHHGRAYQYRHFVVRTKSVPDADQHLRLQFIALTAK